MTFQPHPFGALFREALQDRGFSQRSFHQASELPISTVQMIASGRRAPGLDIFVRICNTLEIPSDWFIDQLPDSYSPA